MLTHLLYENVCLQKVDISLSDRPLDYGLRLKCEELCKRNKVIVAETRRKYIAHEL